MTFGLASNQTWRESLMERFKKIGQKIKEAREQNKMTQGQLGKLLGYTSVAITNYEKGKRKISIDDLERIAQVLGKPLTFFLGENINKSEPPVNILKNIQENLQNALDLTYVPVIEDPSNQNAWVSKENVSEYVAFPRHFAPNNSFIVELADSLLEDKGILKGDYVIVDPSQQTEEGPVLALRNSQACAATAETARQISANVVGKILISFRKYS